MEKYETQFRTSTMTQSHIFTDPFVSSQKPFFSEQTNIQKEIQIVVLCKISAILFDKQKTINRNKKKTLMIIS